MCIIHDDTCVEGGIMPELARQSAELGINIENGVDFNFPVTYKNDGVVVPVTSYTATFRIKDNYSTSENLLELTVGSGITVDEPNGKFTVSISEAQSSFGNRELVYEFIVTSPAGDSVEFLHGKCKSWS